MQELKHQRAWRTWALLEIYHHGQDNLEDFRYGQLSTSWRPYHTRCTSSKDISEVKQSWATEESWSVATDAKSKCYIPNCNDKFPGDNFLDCLPEFHFSLKSKLAPSTITGAKFQNIPEIWKLAWVKETALNTCDFTPEDLAHEYFSQTHEPRAGRTAIYKGCKLRTLL